MKKRLLALLLAAIMVVSLVPMTVFAVATTELMLENKKPITDEASLINLFNFGGVGYLADDVTLTSGLNIQQHDVTLDLAGHVLNLGLKSIVANKAGHRVKLTINDSVSTTEHKFTVDANGLWTYAGAWQPSDVESDTVKKVTGGVITGGKSSTYGAISVGADNTLTLNGGNIVGNKATLGGGGGVSNAGSFIMTGGNIVGNTAASVGGGVYNKGTFTMTGGKITGNTAKNGNGGVYLFSGTGILGGSAVITGNTRSDGTVGNLQLGSAKITLGTGNGEGGNGVAVPTKGFAVGVTTQTAPTADAPVAITSNGTADDVKYFTSDNADYLINFNTDHLELTLIPPHTHGEGADAITFEKGIKTFADLQNLFANGGSGYLANDITATEGLTIAADVTLCLNDKVLNLAGTNITVSEGKTFNLYDCGTTKRYYDKNETIGLWTLKDSGTSDYYTTGGVITGGNAEYAGGVDVWGTLNMNGGNICGNVATDGGGGVYNSGSFTMTAGSIAGNTAEYGGGVYNAGTLNMNGGNICDNTVTQSGGGAYNKGSFTLTAGSVSGNTANYGGGVRNNGIFTMTAGTISGNAANDGGGLSNVGTVTMSNSTIEKNDAVGAGGVWSSGTVTMSGVTIKGNTSDGWGGGVQVAGGSIEMTDGNITGNVVGDGGDGGGVYIGSGGTFTMNRGSITQNSLGANGWGGGIFIEDGTFTVTDGSITKNNAVRGGGVSIYNGVFNATNSEISENIASDNGGAVNINKGIFNATNSEISENIASNKGGAVYVDTESGSELSVTTMTNCRICGNESKWGGGIFINKGNVTVTNCQITGNTASSGGGGVEIENDSCTLIMDGGKITENKVTTIDGGLHKGAGVHFNKGTFTVKGEVDITNNKCADIDSNVYLRKNPVTFNVAEMDTKSSIGVFAAGAEDGSATTVKIADGSRGLSCFTSDNTAFAVKLNKGTEQAGDEYLELEIVAYNYTQEIKYASLAEAISEAVSGDEIELWADENAENVVLPDGVTLYAKSGYTGTVTTNAAGKSVAKQDMFGEYQYKYFVTNVLTITYKDQGDKTFSGTHESGYPTTFMAEVPLELKSATKTNYTFGGWYDNADCTGDPITEFYAYTYTDNITLYAKWICNHTSNRTKVDGQPATESAAGWKDYYECGCGDFFEDATGLIPIENIATWKAEGGNGYIAPLTHDPQLVNGKPATDTEAGFKAYYECKNCGKFFEDATCKVEITNLDAWKAQGGAGYIAKLEKEPTSPQTGDISNMALWLILTALSFMGLCACLVLGKKRKNVQ